ncbi:class I SAM-dependent methyltransferase [Neorhizobium sp. DT-125]|uniref:class I SAM-dependent methyltransferase n=1 Tax=Neorhizobium sp. DT-125 TaxID=3396163 RepID=UPI003F1B84C6
MESTLDTAQVASHWAKTKSTSNWWTNRLARRMYNFHVCGKLLPDPAAGIRDLIRQTVTTPLRKGISVGCGTGVKEIELIKSGVVDLIEGYDLAPGRIKIAKQKAVDAGVADKAVFHCANAFDIHTNPTFDLVYWDNALHHMPDVKAAVQWSHSVLNDGGVFAMDEYVGPNRFLIEDAELEYVNRVRATVPDRHFLKPNASGESYSKKVTRESLAKTIEKDPSEAVDAGATLPAIREIFPDAVIKPTGGMIFFIALNGLYSSFRTDEDMHLLRVLLMLDHEATLSGTLQTLYGAAVAIKK